MSFSNDSLVPTWGKPHPTSRVKAFLNDFRRGRSTDPVGMWLFLVKTKDKITFIFIFINNNNYNILVIVSLVVRSVPIILIPRSTGKLSAPLS